MNRRFYLSLTARAATVLLLATGALHIAGAQDAPAAAPPPPTPDAAAQAPNQGTAPVITGNKFVGISTIPGMGRMITMGMNQMGIDGPIDVTHSNAMLLLKRVDVRTKLGIGNSQREAIEKLGTDSQQELQQKVRGVFQNGQNLGTMTPEERQSALQDRMTQMQTMMETYQGDLDKRVEAILRPAQLKRLKQVDLQWRGPLALSETAVADMIDLTKEQRAKIKPLLEAYQTAATEATQKGLMNMQQSMQANGGFNPQAFRDPNQRAQLQEQMQTRMKTAMAGVKPETEKARKAQGAKVLALLTPDQLTKWEVLVGPKFTFGSE